MTVKNITDEELNALRYPIGEYSPKENPDSEDIRSFISIIEAFPAKLKKAVRGLNDEQLDTQYRPGGWSIRQVVHHVADSHINSYCRFKLALTEDTPAIRPYYEDRWAELPDGKSSPVELSLLLLDALHKRWVVMLNNINTKQLKLKYFHPETKKEATIEYLIGLYAWHCEHHLAHIENLKKTKGW
jgi:hypothetical protein